MKNITLTILISIFSLNIAYAQNFEWAKRIGGTSNDEARCIAIDGSGNVYTTGFFMGTTDFNPGSGTYNLTSTCGNDIFIQKLDSNGSFIWAKQMGGLYDDIAYSIDIDVLGNVYTTGELLGTVDLDPGNGTHYLTSAGTSDIFIQKLDLNGNFIWAKKMGGTYNDIGFSIVIDNSGNVYTTGSFHNTVDFDPGSGIYNITSEGENDIFIQKLDSNGNFIWAKQMGETYSDIGFSIAIDDSGNVYTTGIFRDTVDFDPGNGIYNLISTGNEDAFIQKLNSNGNFIWAKQIGGTYRVDARSISVDNYGSIYITGYFYGTADFNSGSGTYYLTSAGGLDAFAQKLDNNGNHIWAIRMGGIGNDIALSSSIDCSGNVYTTGVFENTVDFDPGNGTYNMTTTNIFTDIFIQKLDANGNFIWAKKNGGSSADVVYSIVIDDSKSIYITGYFNGTADFDPGSGTYNLTSAGGKDIFIQKISQKTIGFTTSQSNFTSPPFNVAFTNTSNGYNSFLWNFGDGNTSSLENPNHIYLNNGTYTVSLIATDTVGNYTDSANAIISCAGLGLNTSSSNDLNVMIYPNPNKGIFTLEINSTSNKMQNYQLEVYTVMGKLIHQEKINGNSNIKKQMHFETLSKGVYFIRLRSVGNVLTAKFEVE